MKFRQYSGYLVLFSANLVYASNVVFRKAANSERLHSTQCTIESSLTVFCRRMEFRIFVYIYET